MQFEEKLAKKKPQKMIIAKDLQASVISPSAQLRVNPSINREESKSGGSSGPESQNL